MIFAKTLTKKLSYYILNYITITYRFFSYKKFLTVNFSTFTDKVSPLKIFHKMHVTIGCAVFTGFTEKVAPSINLINNNVSVMILIVVLRLPKTK